MKYFSQHYRANTIESSSLLKGGQINCEANEGIHLTNGFRASRNATFHAFMGEGGTSPTEWVYEWDVTDHLGNLRMTYADLNGDGNINRNTEILQPQDYYPFGMKKKASTPNSNDNLYGYNGIEEVNDFGLDVNMATFRTLDPALGRWWQVDPEAESLMGLSPYNSMGNSPIMYADPDGDFIPQLVGAVAGAGLNVFNNWQKIAINPISAFGYVATGAGAGVAATLPGGIAASRAILTAGNVATDVATGNVPNFDSFGDVAGYAGSTALNAISTAGTSQALGKLAEQGLKQVAGRDLILCVKKR